MSFSTDEQGSHHGGRDGVDYASRPGTALQHPPLAPGSASRNLAGAQVSVPAHGGKALRRRITMFESLMLLLSGNCDTITNSTFSRFHGLPTLRSGLERIS